MRTLTTVLATAAVALAARTLDGQSTRADTTGTATDSTTIRVVDPRDARLSPVTATTMHTAPDGRALATVQPGATLTPLARDRGWIRVRVEGWVREKDLAPVDAALGTPVSAADLRAAGDSARGRTIRWTVQVLALQKSDPLRRDMQPDETYLIARGPEQENALMYLIVPPALMETVRELPPLTTVIVTGTVRTGRSNPAGLPIIELASLARR
ncbi:MAG TPA: hypothetical protein VFG84_11645 [Gemmatimonadaceae bacterium]|nr:hypothetical protein [Gemmatimonadaceae bacterium]